eukprot:5773876-Pleurochrysis_carterae.AAC.2
MRHGHREHAAEAPALPRVVCRRTLPKGGWCVRCKASGVRCVAVQRCSRAALKRCSCVARRTRK